MTSTTRPRALAAVLSLALAATAFASGAATAAGYPDKPIIMLVGYKAGGQTDLVGRAAARVMSEKLGVPVKVVNKPGAGGVVAAYELKRAAPDGYTLLFHSNSVINSEPLVMKRAELKPDDFEYAGMITAYQVGMATYKDAPYDNLSQFIAWAKKNPGFSYGALSPASRMYMEQIARKEGLDVNIVPLKGGGDMVNAILGKQVAMALSGGINYKYPDQMKMIAALTTFRHPSAPDVKTIEENGYPLGMDSYTTLILPKGTPRPILDTLAAALKAAETDEKFKKIVAAANIPIIYKGVDAATDEMRKSAAKNKTIMESAGIQPK